MAAEALITDFKFQISDGSLKSLAFLEWRLKRKLFLMTYDRFEQVPVWQKAIELGQKIYRFTAAPPFKGQFSMRDQLERAAVSVSNNIAEGFERGTKQELLTFLYYARGSAGEVRSMLALIAGIDWFAACKSEISELKEIAESCSRQLGAWADSLQRSAIKGQRYLTSSNPIEANASGRKSKPARAARDLKSEI